MDILKKNWYLLLIGIATFVLGVIAVVTALRLYQVGKTPVAPTAPKPAPAVTSICTLSFTLAPTPTPTRGPTPTPTATPTPGPTTTPTPGPTATPTPRPTATPTPGPTATPTPGPTATPTPGPTATPTLIAQAITTPTPTPVELPEAGFSTPTLAALLGGVLLLGLALLLAF